MLSPRDRMALGFGAVMIAGVLAVLAFSRRDAIFPPDRAVADAPAGGLTIPTIEEMCKTLGAVEGEALRQCKADEQAAGEFVIAWMGLNGFILNGEISLEQIQMLADLDPSGAFDLLGPDPALGFNPALGANPNADPTILGGANALGSQITGGIDPVTGSPLSILQSPAQLALFCLPMAGDWVTLHDCISENDPSSHIGGTP